MAPTRADAEWSKAYARQSLSDLRVMELLLQSPSVERCHWLHYLQMAAEKVCKAHLSSFDHESVRKVHGYASGTLPVIARSILAADGTKNSHSSWQLKAVRSFAHEIDVLAPSSHDQGNRPDNCEYPWVNSRGAIVVPCEYAFSSLPPDRTLILITRVIRTAAEQYASES